MSTFSVQVMIETSITSYFKMPGMCLMWRRRKGRAEVARTIFFFPQMDVTKEWAQPEVPLHLESGHLLTEKPLNIVKLQASPKKAHSSTSQPRKDGSKQRAQIQQLPSDITCDRQCFATDWKARESFLCGSNIPVSFLTLQSLVNKYSGVVNSKMQMT